MFVNSSFTTVKITPSSEPSRWCTSQNSNHVRR